MNDAHMKIRHRLMKTGVILGMIAVISGVLNILTAMWMLALGLAPLPQFLFIWSAATVTVFAIGTFLYWAGKLGS